MKKLGCLIKFGINAAWYPPKFSKLVEKSFEKISLKLETPLQKWVRIHWSDLTHFRELPTSSSLFWVIIPSILKCLVLWLSWIIFAENSQIPQLFPILMDFMADMAIRTRITRTPCTYLSSISYIYISTCRRVRLGRPLARLWLCEHELPRPGHQQHGDGRHPVAVRWDVYSHYNPLLLRLMPVSRRHVPAVRSGRGRDRAAVPPGSRGQATPGGGAGGGAAAGGARWDCCYHC